MTAPIYRMWNSGLGDLWASVSLLQHTANAREERALLSTRSHWGDKRPLLTEIIDVLDVNRVELTDEPPNTELSGFDVWACVPLRTYQQWEFSARKRRVTYQFDGVSNAEGKNPPAAEQEQVLRYLTEAGFETVRLGSHHSIKECAYLAATSALFVGCDSGLSHVAHSTGVPVYLYEGTQAIITTHRQRQFVPFHNAGEFEANVERYLDLLLSMSGQPRRKG